MCLLLGVNARATNVTLGWNSMVATNMGGYYLYYGYASGNYSGKVDAGMNTTFTVSNLQSGATCYFAVTDRTTQGVESSYSSEAVYTPTNVTVTAPAITSQPASQTVNAGANASFTVGATGTSLSYQWYENSAAISGASAATLTMSSVSTNNAGSYTVTVSNSAGSVTSSAAVLTVVSTNTVAPPVISAQPISQTNNVGTSVTFFCGTTGAAGLYQFQWFKNGGAISGATSYQLVLNNVTTADAGSYYATVANSGGTVTSKTATLTIVSTNTVTPPTITSQPTSQTVNAGANATFSVGATGTSISYQWYENSAAISGASAATLTMSNVSTNNAGSYTVTVSNSAGSVTSSTAVLTVVSTNTVAPPVISAQPISQTNNVGTSVTFFCGTTGAAGLYQFQWYKNSSAIAGATSYQLVLNNVTTADAGSYYTTVANSGGTVTSKTATLTIVSTNTVTPPAITSQPASQTMNAGATATFTVGATGTSLGYQWYKNSGAISGANSSTLTMSSVSTNNAGSYTVNVSNSAGSVTSSAAVLTVVSTNTVAPPVISAQPISQTNNVGTSVTFFCGTTGAAGLYQFQWYKNSSAISGATSYQLVLNNVTTADAGSYYATVANGGGTVTSKTATLTIVSTNTVTPPAITGQPASRTNVVGSTATFTVSATGNPLNYQWFWGSTLIPEANSSILTRTNLHLSDAGSFYVTVSNSLNVVTSTPAILTVVSSNAVTPPVITGQPASRTNVVGSTASFSVTATGNPLNYQWFWGSKPIPGANSSLLTRTNLHLSNAGSYYVTISNSLNVVTSTPAILTMVSSNGNTRMVVLQANVAAPSELTLTPPANPSGPMNIKFTAAPGHAYSLQAATNLLSWTTLWQTNAVQSNTPIEFLDTNSIGFRFYRLLTQ